MIAEIDRSTLEAELESSTATLESNKTEYEYQEKNFVRIKGLHDKGMVSDTDFETAEYNYNKAKSAYDKSKADMFKVRQNLGYATITAPIDGVVIGREVEEGQTVAAELRDPDALHDCQRSEPDARDRRRGRGRHRQRAGRQRRPSP